MSPKIIITEKMTMKEVEKNNPKTREILAPFHIGACVSCDYNLNDTLETVATKNGVPVTLMLQLLNEFH
jgi:hypothetical protein